MTDRRPRAGLRALVAAAVAILAVLISACAGPSPGAPSASPSGSTGAGTPRPITVFAAASLQAAFTEIATLDPTLAVTFSFDGSPTLVDQVLAGAPADVLATADEATMTRAVQGGAASPDPAIFASNREAGLLQKL